MRVDGCMTRSLYSSNELGEFFRWRCCGGSTRICCCRCCFSAAPLFLCVKLCKCEGENHKLTDGRRILSRGCIVGDFSLGKFNVTLDCFCSWPVGMLINSMWGNPNFRVIGNDARWCVGNSRRYALKSAASYQRS